MEVAGQWRRQWAGTAEYGKVTEGGVTRQVARAMEVVHATAPGARVRVMRAAYHSSAAKGAPAASFLMHSSHSVISSGSNVLETPTFSSKPIEISSTPLEYSPERNTENYKVTDPDDYEISTPSKWKSCTGRNSIRISSEESSSADNASVIDLDPRYKNRIRNSSYDSENSDIPMFTKNNARMSHLLDEPAALSTLKYRSLLNGNNDWNHRRKSYSFENTGLNELLRSEDTLVLESSTDSGICKSTELITDSGSGVKSNTNGQNSVPKESEDSFEGWLKSKNRMGPFYHNVAKFEGSSRVTSQKFSVTIPVALPEDFQSKIVTEEDSRKLKKVEFSKTELHFIPDTGKVNIIDTDNKPPPSQDFRRRKTEFLFNGKPVTLLSNASKESFDTKHDVSPLTMSTDMNEFEDIAAKKSILKNKMPIPKPYLLGENMEFENSEDSIIRNKITYYDSPKPMGLSQISRKIVTNKQLHEKCNHEIKSSVDASIGSGSTYDRDWANRFSSSFISEEAQQLLEAVEPTSKEKYQNYLNNKVNPMSLSPTAMRAKTRQLRDSDLTYFGINNNLKTTRDGNKKYGIIPFKKNNSVIDCFQSVKLIKNISAENKTESDEPPEYQNIPQLTNFALIPTPRPRSKFGTTHANSKEIAISTNEPDNNITKESRGSRRRTSTKLVNSNRSISAPPKIKPEKSKQMHESARLHHDRSPEGICRSTEHIRLSLLGLKQISNRSPESERHSSWRTRRSPEQDRHSPGRKRRSPEQPRRTRPSAERALHSPGRISRSPAHLGRTRPSPERARHFPGTTRRSPEHLGRTSPSPERVRHSLGRIRHYLELTSPSPKYASHSSIRNRRSPERISPSPDCVSQSPERIRCSPERTSPFSEQVHQSSECACQTSECVCQSPEQACQFPEHTCQSPEHICQSPECCHCSPEQTSFSSEPASHSPERIPRDLCAHGLSKRIHSSPERSRNYPGRLCPSAEQPGGNSCSPKCIRRSPERPRHSLEKLRRRPSNHVRHSVEQSEVTSAKNLPNGNETMIEPVYINSQFTPDSAKSSLGTSGRIVNKIERKKERVIKKFENRNPNIFQVLVKPNNTNDVDIEESKINSLVKIRTKKRATPDYTDKGTQEGQNEKCLHHNSPVSYRTSGNCPQNYKMVKPESIKDDKKNLPTFVENSDNKCDKKITRRISPNSRQVIIELNKQIPTIKLTTEPKNTERFRRSTTKKNSDYKSPHRSKYIINYDDKNGTVSSVSKVKHDSLSTKKKPIKDNKEAPTEHKSKIKATEKIALLQSAENQWDSCELNYADRKWKRKMHVQRSCQLL